MRAHVITFGCQMNEYDTHTIQSELVAGGHELVAHPADADLLLLNTCAVRGKPVEKVISVLGDLRKQRSAGRDVTVGLMGCLAQLDEGRDVAQKFGVDLLVGPGAITDLLEALDEHTRLRSQEGKGMVERRGFEADLHDYLPPPPGGLAGFLTIMRGCNHHCTYCIVPDTRGPEVSRPVASIMREAEAMREAGIVEVTLLGQNVNSYGVGRPDTPSFPELLRLVADLGFERVKFTTSHPMNFTSALIDVIAQHEAVCNYIHLPMQSGSDRVLRRMAREYRIDRYLGIVEEIRAKVADVVISTDIIVGFPGETEEDFEATLAAARAASFEQAYMFMYSARPGTPSYKHFEDMPREVKVERLQRLIDAQKERSLRANEALVGRNVRVLVKDLGRDSRWAVGHSDQNHTVLVPADSVSAMGLRSVTVTSATPHALYGEVVGADRQGIELVMAS
ncbi:MAG: tRNA (N6-isopentenyl adenosine(37)-C2)-methylthiotransferase MiaB [Trueperaceae bacterium]|nr:tRNA (N6-isopentenyl adenosine(37)-C2)-methylthiotransferase MiaB [Trueperaceae bacterium]